MIEERKKYLFRCDSSEILGTGHLFRCLSLAKQLRSRGHIVLFQSHEWHNHSIRLIEANAFPLVRIATTTPEPLGGDEFQRQDASITLKTIKDFNPNKVIVDHYALNAIWEQTIEKNSGRVVLAIDDVFRTHCCGALLDQNFHLHHAQLWQPHLPSHTRAFLGPRFAMLDESFAKFTPSPLKVLPPRSALVFFGGTDPYQGTEQFLKEWEAFPLVDLSVTLLIGAANSRASELHSWATRLNLKCIVGSNSMASLMSQNDLYIGAGGSITWERSYFGLPAIVLATATNQAQFSQELGAAGAHLYLGMMDHLRPGQLSQEIQALRNDPVRLKLFSQASLALQVGVDLSTLLKYLEE